MNGMGNMTNHLLLLDSIYGNVRLKHPKGLLDTHGPAERGRIPSSGVFRRVRTKGIRAVGASSPQGLSSTKS